MPLPLRRALAAGLRRGLSTAAAPRPSWAMIYHTMLVSSSEPRASLVHAEPPLASHLLVPAHVVDPRPRPDRDGGDVASLLGAARASSGDGFLLLDFWDCRAAAPVGGRRRTAGARQSTGVDSNPGIARVVCNPLSGQLFRLPDIDGTSDTVSCQSFGLLTRSERPHGPPDRYAVAGLVEEHGGGQRSFVMRRFLSQTGEWEKLVGLPYPLPLAARRMVIDHAVLDFAGRLWWVDVSWGAVSADPLSDRPELCFVELPSGCVKKAVKGLQTLGRHRRMGVSEGKLRYVEVSQKEPFFLSSYALEDDYSSWMLECNVALSALWKSHGSTTEENAPRIGAIDPLKPQVYVTTGHFVFAVDIDKEKLVGFSMLGEGAGPASFSSGFLKPCVLPSDLESSWIPSAGKKEGARNKTLGEVLVRADRY
ncbi:unnamed protein product [Urochloa humidicola]